MELVKDIPSDYPQVWLENSSRIFSNLEILNMTNEERNDIPILSGWFNPFDEPEKLDTLRLELSLKPDEWKDYVIENFPGVDAKKEHKKRKDEIRKRRIEMCGQTGKWKWDPVTFSKVWQPHFCKSKECPKCAAKIEEAGKERLNKLQGRKLVNVQPDEEDNFKAGLTKSDYLRIPQADGSVSFVLNEIAQPGEKSLMYTDVLKLAKEMATVDNGRVSGSLGKIQSIAQEEENQPQEEVNFLDDFERLSPENLPHMHDIAFRTFQIDFSDSIYTPSELEREVLSILEADDKKHTFDNLQYIVYQLEELTQMVCRENNIKILFLYKGYKTVDYSEIRWDKLNRFKQKY